MKNMKKFIGVFILALVLFVPSVFALNEEDLIKNVVPNGESITIKSIKPTTYEYAYELISNYVDNNFDVEGYRAWGDCNPEDLTECLVHIDSENNVWNYQTGELISGFAKDYEITVTYDEPSKEQVTTVKPIIDDIVSNIEYDMADPSTYYKVEDLSLINYFLTGEKSELWNPGAASRAIKFSNINELTNGANITFGFNVGLGEQGEDLMYESAGTGLIIYYDGYRYASTQAMVHLRRVIYIPEDTADTTDAYIAAAQKRINDYLGNESVKVTLGGALTTLADSIDENSTMYGATYEDLLDATVDTAETDGNYYNIKVLNRTYKFYIIKSDEIPENPTYSAVNLDSNVVITSDDASVPLDTSITVKEVSDSKINEALGTDELVSYDITLYSDALSDNIKKLENGKFKVSIPVPETLKDKDINVYYVNNDNGEVELHNATVIDGIASFETDHFSTYTLAANVNLAGVESPNTIDNIQVNLVIGMIALAGLASASLYLNKQRG
ncbi:MAG: hypothetical protein IJ565_02030 [Bacilli bacterium]|nr:hypothetical protein [Bacilli bacterium]